ncbi:MAG: tetratricopeptide repeat protein [Candidatus Kapaibacteriota bacterium]|jgi:tetratricopeptide (TPR) repeat protein
MENFDDPISLIDRANSEFITGNIDSVIEILQEGIQKYDEFPLLFILLVRAYLQINDFEKAKRTLELGIEKFPYNRSLQQLEKEINIRIRQFASSQSDLLRANLLFFPFQRNFSKILGRRINFVNDFLSIS